jgi:hypothetical protein
VTARFASNLLVLILGAALAPARFIFGPGSVHWITFGAGAAVTMVVAAAFLVRGRGPVQRGLDVVMALIGAWSAVSGLVFGAAVVGWLALGEGGALALLAIVGLVAHEVLMERPLRVVERQAAPDGHVASDGLAFTPAQRRAQVPVAPWPS